MAAREFRQRQAEPFTVSPLHCGTARSGYRDSVRFGGEISLGTALAISGAAADPNMGYNASPIIGFFMTLFNLRLGSWLGNPGVAGNRTWTRVSPHSAIQSLVRAALDHDTDESPYVNLSDGGHFENLGLYEMVRRRCRSIVVLDAGCDPDFSYEDLANAVRKIRIDLKIPIAFRQDVGPPPPAGKMKRCAIATIRYSAVDPACADGELVYIKPMFLGGEPPDVTSYHTIHQTFPHQRPGDQRFDESQTESYRMLGQHTVSEILTGWDPARSLAELPRFIDDSYLAVVPPAPAVAPGSGSFEDFLL